MKFFAVEITEDTLPLVTVLNEGVEPSPASMNHMFIYPATKPDENISTIITRQEFNALHVIFDACPLYILK